MGSVESAIKRNLIVPIRVIDHTPFTDPEGNQWFDTAKWLFVHKISPYVDIERELLFSDLKAAGVIAESKKLQFAEPLAASSDLSETPFFTDGKIYEVVLK